MTEYCFGKDTSFDELGDLHEPKADSALHSNVSVVLAAPRIALAVRGIRRVRSQRLS